MGYYYEHLENASFMQGTKERKNKLEINFSISIRSKLPNKTCT